jgi:hypothetical protein
MQEFMSEIQPDSWFLDAEFMTTSSFRKPGGCVIHARSHNWTRALQWSNKMYQRKPSAVFEWSGWHKCRWSSMKGWQKYWYCWAEWPITRHADGEVSPDISRRRFPCERSLNLNMYICICCWGESHSQHWTEAQTQQAFLQDFYLIYHTEARWLCCGAVLQRLWTSAVELLIYSKVTRNFPCVTGNSLNMTHFSCVTLLATCK